MGHRIIKSIGRRSSVQLADCIGSLFALEMMSPSRELYIFSPWISDMPIVKNAFGQFRSLLPEHVQREIRLSTLLNVICERGGKVHIMCRPPSEKFTRQFLSNLSNEIEVRQHETIHEKGLVGEYFYLRGSMNFTYSGMHLNDENTELTTDRSIVNNALLEARARWQKI